MRKKRIAMQALLFSSFNLTVLGFLVLALISWPLIKNIKKQLNVNKEISFLQQEIKNLEGKNSELKGLITYLNSDQFIEEQAKLNLNYKRAGEQVVVIKDAQEENVTQIDNQAESLKSVYQVKGLNKIKPSKTKSNFKKWLEYFWQ